MSAATWTFDQLTEGQTETHDYRVTPDIYEAFLAAFQDHSPVHVDEAHAKSRGFSGRVMHGAILNGFVSHFVGMRFPGRAALLQSVDLRYSAPVFLDDRVRITGKISQKSEANRVIVLTLELTAIDRAVLVARGKAMVGVADV